MGLGWGKHREEICHLYLDQRKTLKQVVNVMKEKHGVKASYVFQLS
jgi:hypothetical protein